MSRPVRFKEPRVNTAVRFPVTLHDRLKEAADERDVSVNWLVNRAVQRLLANLPAPGDGDTTATSGDQETGPR